MVDLVVLALAAHYVTYVLVGSELVRPVRSLLSGVPLVGQVVTCYNCASIWAGAFVLVFWTLGTIGPLFVYACALGTATQLLYQIREKLLP